MSYKLQSLFASRIRGMMRERAERGYSVGDYAIRLANFDRFCAANFPNSMILTQEIAFAWCNDSKGNAGTKRAVVIREFGRYLLASGEHAYVLPDLFFPAKKLDLPYIIPDVELEHFFRVTDNYPSSHRNPLIEYTVPVIFRLQYACGLRPQEVRILRKIDVNFMQGSIYISDGKHYKDRRLAVSTHVMEMCEKYDGIAESIMPRRTHFFPSLSGSAYSSDWLSSRFSECWAMSGNGDKRGNCVPYSLTRE